MLAVTSVTFFLLADVKCGLYGIKESDTANATHGSSLIQKMLRDQSEAMLDRRYPGPGPVLTPVDSKLRDLTLLFKMCHILLV